MKFSEMAKEREKEIAAERQLTAQQPTLKFSEARAAREAEQEEENLPEMTPIMQQLMDNTLIPRNKRESEQTEIEEEPIEEPKDTTTFDASVENPFALPIPQAMPFLSEDAPSISHTVKLFGEQYLLSSAEFVDFLRKANNWKNSIGSSIVGGGAGGFSLGTIEIDGEVIDDQSFEEVTKHWLTRTGDLEESEVPLDTATKLLAQNLGPGGVIAGGLKLAKKTIGFTSDILKFVKEESKLSLIGSITGTTGGQLFGDDQQSSEDIAEIFNLVGMFGAPLIRNLPVNIVRRVIKNGKTNPLFDREGAMDLAESEVNKHLASLVPKELIPEIEARMKLVREIQKMEPDFQPSNGVMIGTEEALMTQRVVDTENYPLATSQYLKTKAAVERLTARLEMKPRDEDSIKIAAALRLYARETRDFLEVSTARIVGLEESLRNVADANFSSTKNGAKLRKEYDDVRKIYRAERDNLYNMVDPLGEVQFSPDHIIGKVTNLIEGTDPLKRISEADAGYSYIKNELPKIIEEMSRRSAVPKGPAGVNQALGFTPKEKPYLTYRDIKGIYEELGKRANTFSRTDPSATRLLNGLRQDLLKTLDEDMVKGSSEVARRYEEARKFMTDEYYTRFKEGVGGTLARTGDAKIPLDEIGDSFWKKGNKRVSMEEFHKIFLEGSSLIDPSSITEVSILARQALSEHAMKSLQDALDSSPKTDPLEVLQKWKHTYRGALDSFEDVAERVDDMEDAFRTLSSDKSMGADKAAELNTNIIKKYINVESSDVVSMLYKATPEEAGRMMQDILRSTAKSPADASYINKYPDLLNPTESAGNALSQAVRRNFISHIIGKAFDTGSEAPSASKLIGILKEKDEVLRQILTEDDVANLYDFQKALKLMGDANIPLKKVQLNKLKELGSKVGISPASMLSRYYSASLGKVGPVYLITDFLTRLATGVTSKHFNEVYKKAMYDLDGLENVLKHVGAPDETLSKLTTMKEAIKDAVKSSPAKLRNKAVEKVATKQGLIMGFRLEEMLERREEIEATGGTEGDLVEFMLLSNDDHTGQPSRLRPDGLEGSGVILGAEEVMDPIEEDTPSETLTAPTADVTETDTIVPVKEELPVVESTETPTISAEENAQIDATIPPTKEEEQQTMLQDRAKEYETYEEFEKHLKSVFTSRAPKTDASFDKLIPQIRAAWESVHSNKDTLDAMEILLKNVGGSE